MTQTGVGAVYKALIVVLGLATNVHQDENVWKESLQMAMATRTGYVASTLPKSLPRGRQ